MRGRQENVCLKRVKEYSDKNSIEYYCNDSQRIYVFLKSATPNPADSNFPDFLCKNGFIEHFQITAAKETKKGSAHNTTQAQFEREASKKFQQIQEVLEKAAPENSLTCEINKMKPPTYNYEQYVASFQKNWEHHIDSFRKYDSRVETGIFLVEYQGPLFKILRNGKSVGFYRLHKDVGMLEYIAKDKDQLSHVIFVDSLSCEVIELNAIPSLIKQAPTDISFEPGSFKHICMNIGVNIDITKFEG